ncbi:unnamed protein product, partial [Brenthis ino]
MHSVFYILLLIGSSLAHYRGYESRNHIEREEPHTEMDSLVECPVCEISQAHEECTIDEGNKRFKRCQWDTYFNEKCGNRLDCYRGPGETCTEKMENDIYGQKCARGCYCDGAVHQCVCVGYKVDHYLRLIFANPLYRYPLPSQRDEEHKPLMLLA